MPQVLKLTPGNEVSFKGTNYRISHMIDMNHVLAEEMDSGDIVRLEVSQLKPAISDVQQKQPKPLDAHTDEEIAVAEYRLAAIQPLMNSEERTRKKVEDKASELSVHVATIYRWIRDYTDYGGLTALVPRKRSGGRGNSRLPAEIERIMEVVIGEKYLSKKQRKVSTVYKELKRQCHNAGIEAPHINTLRKRIASLKQQEASKHRRGRKITDDRYSPIIGPFPGADFPLAYVQIDHSQSKIDLVDDEYRESIGKPWITLAIDVFSRMVTGFYISFDPPGAMATGMCMVHSILPKENWLANLDLTGDWPVWGVMRSIHMDNAKEFRGEMLKQACKEHTIDIELRPVKNPKYGGHIERLMGTATNDLEDVPGAVLRNAPKGTYQASKAATMTLSEFEKWLTIYIVDIYHQRKHEGIGMSPIKRYNQGVFGDDVTKGTGLMPRIVDELHLRLDFMPFIRRSVQRYGLLFNFIHYYHDSLRRWIAAEEQKGRGRKKQFLIKYDPRDLSSLYFLDPELNEYFEIPYRDASRPPISIWELRAANRFLKDQGIEDINEELIFDAYNRLKELEEQAAKKTRSVRRQKQRKRDGLNRGRPRIKDTETATSESGQGLSEDIKPFDEMEEVSW